MSMQDVFNICVVIFTVTNTGALGLETNMHEARNIAPSARLEGVRL